MQRLFTAMKRRGTPWCFVRQPSKCNANTSGSLRRFGVACGTTITITTPDVVLGEHEDQSTDRNQQQHVLVLSNLYPQPSSSAAGSRTEYIIRQLARNTQTWDTVHFAASSKEIDEAVVTDLQAEGVHFHYIEPNNSEEMKALLDRIGSDLSLVIYDKFYTEEAFSFHIHNLRPDAVQVVDMQDMHSLRRGRQAVAKKLSSPAIDASTWWEKCLRESVSYIPENSDKMLLRELASLHRSDISLVCSPIEHKLLVNKYQLPASKVCTASFWVDTDDELQNEKPSFAERRHFCFVGGFRHDPNVDAVQQLAKYIWPHVRKVIPDAEMHVYGAHASGSIQALHNPKQGFHVLGFTPDLEATLLQYRVLLAPLRYGAGIKGKIVDAWTYGLPVVTTPIGSEGMLSSSDEWGGEASATSIPAFCDAAIKLYTNEDAWNTTVRRGQELLKELYSASGHWGSVAQSLEDAVKNRSERRSKDLMRSILWQEQTRSTEYFSRWIEAKNKNKPTS